MQKHTSVCIHVPVSQTTSISLSLWHVASAYHAASAAWHIDVESKFLCSLDSCGVLLCRLCHSAQPQYFDLCCQFCVSLANHGSSHRGPRAADGKKMPIDALCHVAPRFRSDLCGAPMQTTWPFVKLSNRRQSFEFRCGKKGLKDQDAQDVLVLIGHVDTDAHVLCAIGHSQNSQAGSRTGIAASHSKFRCQGFERIGV